jgi:hypothetical protein
MDTNLLVICYHKWTPDGLSVLVKYLQLNTECSFVMLLQNMCHGRKVAESLVKNMLHQ